MCGRAITQKALLSQPAPHAFQLTAQAVELTNTCHNPCGAERNVTRLYFANPGLVAQTFPWHGKSPTHV